MNILVTGGAGFIGSNFILYKLALNDGCRIINVDKLTYAGNLENLKAIEGHPRYSFVCGDVGDADLMEDVLSAAAIDAVVHFAAESHVDRSIEEPTAFLNTNVLGTQTVLGAVHRHRIPRLVHISTDEVYGSLGPHGLFTEDTPLAANSPYAASKAAADLLVRAAINTYGIAACIIRCSNNYGPLQFPEKLIPLMVSNALDNKPLPVYGDGQQVRDWVYVEDHCRAIDSVLQSGRPGEVYNVGGRAERTNLEVVEAILHILDKPRDLVRFVQDRPGHDRRYAMDTTKIEHELGWQARWSFEAGLAATVDWYRQNTAWLDRVRSGAYQTYYERVYGQRARWIETVQSRTGP